MFLLFPFHCKNAVQKVVTPKSITHLMGFFCADILIFWSLLGLTIFTHIWNKGSFYFSDRIQFLLTFAPQTSHDGPDDINSNMNSDGCLSLSTERCLTSKMTVMSSDPKGNCWQSVANQSG